MIARLSTHVLDTSLGLPAGGVGVDLHILRGADRQALATAITNADGRTDAPLLAGERIEVGVYELTFHAADYFREAGAALTDPPFLGDIVVRFGIADPAGQYHVPVLISPYGYSTYRGT